MQKEQNKPFTLIPCNGVENLEIIKEFDGLSSDFKKNEEKCMWMLSDGVNRFSDLNSYYSTPETNKSENRCLAMETSAAEAKRIGLRNLASVITCENIEHKIGMQHVLVERMSPSLRNQGPKMAPHLRAIPKMQPKN